MRFSVLLSALFCAIEVQAAGKTSIYIDRVALYSELPKCAEERVSAIVRAQFSGCGDDMQLTSFSCFCIDSSSEFSSIISTAVQDSCSVAPASVTLTSQAPVVTSALEVFQSYCAMSTLLPSSKSSESSTSTLTTIVTPPPETIVITSPTASSENSDKKSTNLAAIVAPAVIVPLLAIAGAVFFFFFWRRRRAQGQQPIEDDAREMYDQKPPGELVGDELKRPEMQGDDGKKPEMQGSGTVYYAHELASPAEERAELEGEPLKMGRIELSKGGE